MKTNSTKGTRKKAVQEGSQSRLNNLVKPDGMTLEEWQVALRKQAAEKEQLVARATDDYSATGEYKVYNPKTRETYKVVYRGVESEWNYCSCMDFRTSQLGTCKHLEAVKLTSAGKRTRRSMTTPAYSSVYVSYRHAPQVAIRFGSAYGEQLRVIATEYFDEKGHLLPDAYDRFDEFLTKAKAIDPDFRCYDDALDFVVERREAKRRERMLAERYADDKALDGLIDAQLYPYQREGVRFAAKVGRSIIADEMGLGKTIQAIATAELLRKEGLVSQVLIICPTSLKYQWKQEIERFVHAEVLVVEGLHTLRLEQYQQAHPYKIVSYNSLCNDLKVLRTFGVDMVILDEVQRLKNWDTQIARSMRRVRSDYAVLLSGTPLENKLEELYSIVELVDQYALAPYYQFRHRYIVVDEVGRIIGYQNLGEIRQRLAHIMIRRRKADVHLQLPARTDQNILVPMTEQQREMHDEYKSAVAAIVLKWQRTHFITEKERKRLLLLLSQMRMVCDSTYILDQQSRYDTKVDELMNILDNYFASGEGKAVVFSGWERMTRLVAQELTARRIGFEYLHGGIPSAKRKDLVSNFTNNPDCRVFLSTDAGSTGLNLQAAQLIINLDLPWNPAVLEQRVARIYRIGQQSNIHVINLVSAGTIEEQMIGRLRFKSSLFEGALDGGEDVIFAADDKFKGIMQAMAEYVEAEESATPAESPEPTKKDQVGVQTRMFEEETSFAPNNADPQPPTANVPTEPTAAQSLISQGSSFIASLTRTLSDPQATKELVDALVHEDKETGQASLQIPVESRDTVRQFFTLVGQLMSVVKS